MATTRKKKLNPIRRGDTHQWVINMPGIDITGILFRVTLKEDINDPNPRSAISITATSSATTNNPLDDPANGIINIMVPASMTSKLSIQEYQIGMSMETTATPENIIKTFLVDTIEVIPDVHTN